MRAGGVAWLWSLAVAAGCATQPPPTRPALAAGAPANVEVRRTGDRPPLGLLAREGDPRGAVALAIAHDFGAEASAGLAEIVAQRVRGAGLADVIARPHLLGFVVSALVGSGAESARFIEAATRSLGAVITEAPPVNAIRAARGAGDAEVARCSGELVASEGGGKADAAALEQWRRQVYSSSSAAFGAAGPRAVLESATHALDTGPTWPRAGEPEDAWPVGDTSRVDGPSERRLSVAYRLPDAARALGLARALGAPGSLLSARLEALEPKWTLERVVATARVRGACLRVDARAPRGEPAPRASDVARAAAVLEDEVRPLLDRPGDPWVLDDAVLRASDPRDAAAAAAWRALTGRKSAGPPRRALSYGAPKAESGDAASAELERELARVSDEWRSAGIPRRTRVEAGQGELWALVASSCGTGAESTNDAGRATLLVRALASRRSGILGVELEAWSTPDGVGLLAHASRQSGSESAEELGRRVGDALGRALVVTRLGGADVADLRRGLMEEIGPAGQRGYWTLLDRLSGGHPSWLEPRGTWQSVAAQGTDSLDGPRRALLAAPLRLAVLANASEAQANATGAALDRWLRPYRLEQTACPDGVRSAFAGGEVTVGVSGPALARAYVALPIAPDAAGIPRAAEWTVHLLNRKGGWLEQALGKLVGQVGARAAVMGGRRAAALLIEIQALDGPLDPAVKEVRALVERLSQGAATEADAEIARQHFAAIDARGALDPRRRLTELWRGNPSRSADLAALHRLHASFAAPAVLVVRAEARE